MYGAAVSGSGHRGGAPGHNPDLVRLEAGIYSDIRNISDLSERWEALMTDLDGVTDHLKGRRGHLHHGPRFSALEDTFVAEMNSFTRSLKDLFQVISRQQEGSPPSTRRWRP